MFLRWRVPLCTLILIYLINKSFGSTNHTYPKSDGLSGSNSHNYPSSDGLSGGGHGYPPASGGHKYPSFGGTNYTHPPPNYGYPTPGGSNRYPPSGSIHGYPTTVSNNGYLSSGYPSSDGKYNSTGGNHRYAPHGSGNGYPPHGANNGYPHHGGSNGYSSSDGKYNSTGGNNRYSGDKVTAKKIQHYPPKNTVVITHTRHVYENYEYTPPKMIKYIPGNGAAPIIYPVYQNAPPSYVYKIKDSGSKYETLLAGLALMNLGLLANSSFDKSYNGYNYKAKPGEVCFFTIQQRNGDYEETQIDCQLMSSFIIHQEILAAKSRNNSATITSNVPTNGVPGSPTSILSSVLYSMLPNGTLVPLNITSANPNLSTAQNSFNSNVTSSVTIKTTNTTVINALDVKGKPVELMSDTKCFVRRITTNSRMKKSLPCKLLQTFSDRSIHRNSAFRNGPAFTMLLFVFSVYFIC